MKSSYDVSKLPKIQGAKVAILQAAWYSEHSDVMVKHCSSILNDVGAEILHPDPLPGTMELPLAARDISRAHPELEAIILFGIVLEGETKHFEMIVETVSRGIERVTFECDIPVINEIIPATSLEQVISRTSDNESNKGREAAIAATKVIHWRRALKNESSAH